ncbi:hypothetical protein R3W88_032908 [Solanum pinnatisectum]|uniref:DUF7769 domain-containing protein n=1 Tax=Solanum pinnatisectum TaxID=50273 RepID=A0AAV9LQI5_9SOLN|nr:hypothetical protein R3W88_032908 [Solanum pinnatisectum]
MTTKLLNNDERRALYEMLLRKSINGKLKKTDQRVVASQFLVSLLTVQRIWEQSGHGLYDDVSHHKTKNCVRKRIEMDYNLFREIPLHKRMNLRSLAWSMNMTKSTLARRLKSGDFRRHSNAIKPHLSILSINA